MVRLRLAVTVFCLLLAASAHAQQTLYTGMITAHIGAAAGGDVEGRGVTPGASMLVVDDTGVGAEIDIGHTRAIDQTRFSSTDA